MDEDLKDIDLIDRYLSNELDEQEQQAFKDRYLHDPEFKKEVEVYRKIYQGVEQAGHEALKKRLEGYYNEFVREDLSIEHAEGGRRGKIIPIGRLRSGAARIITGIAASLLLAIGVWIYVSKNALDNRPIAAGSAGHKMDSANGKLNHYAGTASVPSKDSGGKAGIGQPVAGPKAEQYGLTGGRIATLPVLEADYPQPLSYTFNGQGLSIYGEPLLGLVRLHVLKTGERYRLWYDGDIYRLDPCQSPRALKKEGKSEEFGQKSSETIQVQVQPLQASASPWAALTVRVSPGRQGSYRFSRENGRMALELLGNFAAKYCQVIRLKKNSSPAWYLVNGSSVYPLDENNARWTRLRELSGLQSEQARLFVKRAPVSLPVYLRK